MSNGEPIICRVALKPIPTLARTEENSLKSIDKINGYKIIENKNQSSSKSTVKSYWIVGTTLLINFKKTKRL